MPAFLYAMIFIFISPITLLMAAPVTTCNIHTLEKMLEKISLDKKIRTNQELITALEYKYGQGTSDYFKSLNLVLIENPHGAIDEQTVKWAQSAIWSPENPKIRYKIIFAEKNQTAALKEQIVNSADLLYISGRKTELVFPDIALFQAFNTLVNNEFLDLIKKNNPNLSDHNAAELLVSFKKNYLKDKRYHLGFNDIKQPHPVVVIEGHGAASIDGITIGDVDFTSNEIIDHLIKLKLPSDATIKLDVCFAGCSTKIINLELVDIVELFTESKLQAWTGMGDGSFLKLFTQQLHQTIPEFQGKVQGYIGAVTRSVPTRIMDKSGNFYFSAHSTEITGLDGHLDLKKEDARIEISRKDL